MHRPTAIRRLLTALLFGFAAIAATGEDAAAFDGGSSQLLAQADPDEAPAEDAQEVADEDAETDDADESPQPDVEETDEFEDPVERPPEQFVLLEMRLPEALLTRDLDAYYDLDEDTLWLPLTRFVELVEFPIDVALEEGRAQGWFRRPEHTFDLDMRRGTITIADEIDALQPGQAERHLDDIYVEITTLAEWFGFDWEFTFSLMELELDPDPPFVIQERIARAQRRERITKPTIDREPTYEVVKPPYQIVSSPVFDIDLSAGLPTTTQIRESDDRRRTVPQSNRYQLRGAGDLLWMNSYWSISGSERHPIRRTRFRMSRRDPSAGLLGPMEATELAAGDIVSPSSSLVTRSDRGRGVEVSSFPVTRAAGFDYTNVTGNKEPGWDVELYRNDVLIDFQPGTDTDYYHFDEVPLRFGVNEIRVVQYGPYGQQEEDVYTYHIGPGMISPDEDHYRISVSQHDTDLLPLGTLGAETAATGKPRAIAQYERGVIEEMAVGAQMATVPLRDGGQRFYGSGGIRVSFDRVYTAFDMVVGDGSALQAALQTGLGNYAISAESAVFVNDFISEDIYYPAHTPRNRSRIRFNGVLPFEDVFRIPFTLSLENFYFSDRGHRTRLSNRLSARLFGVWLVHNLQLRHPPGGDLSTYGTMMARYRTRRVTPYAQMSYGLDRGVRSYRLGTTWRMGNDLQSDFHLLHRFGQRGDISVRAGLNHQIDYFSWGFNVGWGYRAGPSIGANISTSFGHNPNADRWAFSSESMTRAGMVVPRVYWDKSQNGHFDPDVDEPIEESNFVVDGVHRDEYVTNEEGIAALPRIRTHEYTDVELRRRSLYDPFFVPSREGHTVVARPGVHTEVDFPVVMTGEVDGTVRYVHDGVERPATSLTMQLLDEDGEIVDETTTAFDGFYLFDFLKPGTYTVRPDPQRLEARNFEVPDEKTVEIDVDGTIVTGQDFAIGRLE